MRGPKRIYKVLNAVRLVWSLYPDMRFTQFMTNVMDVYRLKTDSAPFYLEDDDFIEFLMEYIREV